MTEKNKAASVAQELSPEWIWNWLMDYCQRRSVSPATHDSLFQMVKDARALLAQAAPPAAPLQWMTESEFIRDWESKMGHYVPLTTTTVRQYLTLAAPAAPATGESGDGRHFSGGNQELPSETMARIRAASAQQDEREAFALVPRVMTAAMINAWSGGKTVTTDEVAARTAFQDAWKRVLDAVSEQVQADAEDNCPNYPCCPCESKADCMEKKS